MDGYQIGQRPPDLQEDGSFKVFDGSYAYSVIDDMGRFLKVDKTTRLLVVDTDISADAEQD
jgi:hypothetical protein